MSCAGSPNLCFAAQWRLPVCRLIQVDSLEIISFHWGGLVVPSLHLSLLDAPTLILTCCSLACLPGTTAGSPSDIRHLLQMICELN